MPHAQSGMPFPRGARIFRRMYTRLGCRGRPPQFAVQFYPYANLVHTIRLKEDAACVRLSDLLRAAPLEVLEAAAAILLARLYRRRPPCKLVEVYRRFSLARGTRRRLLRARRERARRVQKGPRGQHHDLRQLFDKLKQRYFRRQLPRPRLGWSSRHWRTQLGSFDPALNQIVLNARLDGKDIPQFVVEYVLFHEMLHVKHPLRAASCGLQAHSARFRSEERRFASYQRARRFLARLT